jgi:hypothetical protein
VAATNSEEYSAFTSARDKSRQDFDPIDRTSFKAGKKQLAMLGDEVIGETGSEVVHNDAEGDAKANFTFFALTSGRTIHMRYNARRARGWVNPS